MQDDGRQTIIGVGNVFRQDDGAGIEVIKQLRKSVSQRYELVESTGEGGELLEVLKTHRDVVIIDAVSSGGKPGTLHRFDVHTGQLPANLTFGSSHAFGVASAIEMARTMGWLPAKCELIGIEGKSFGFGGELTPAVELAISDLVRHLQMPVDQCDDENLLTTMVDEAEETGEGLI